MAPVCEDVVIIGGGLGAVRTVEALRDRKFEGDITVISCEEHLPYDRPPLSKEFLLSTSVASDLALVDAARWDELEATVHLSSEVVSIDAEGRTIGLADGTSLGWSSLVVATGARARLLPVLADLTEAVPLRDVEDAQTVRAAMVPGARFVVVGAGFIGLEVAATARSVGCEVTVVEFAALPLQRVLGAELGAWARRWHEGHGVAFRCGVEVTSASSDGTAAELILSDGTVLAADVVVVGVGVERDTGWLADAGLLTHVGLVCDESGRASAEGIFGVGDVTCVHVGEYCEPTAHWTAACDQAEKVAAAIAGEADAWMHGGDGYFWSSQYSARIQFAGRHDSAAVVEVVAGSMADDKFVARLVSDGATCGVFGVGLAKVFVTERRLLGLSCRM